MKKIVSILMVLVITITTAMCTAVPASAAAGKVRAKLNIIPGGVRVYCRVEGKKEVDKWSVMYSKNEDSGYKGYKNISGSQDYYDIDNLEYDTKYYFYITAVIDGKTVKSEIKEHKTASFKNLEMMVLNDNYPGFVYVCWNEGLKPDSVSIFYSDKKNGKYIGYKNIKGEGDSGNTYSLPVFEFKKNVYVKLVLTHNGKSYSEIQSVTLPSRPAAVSKKSQVTSFVANAVKKTTKEFRIYYKSKSIAMKADEMFDKYGCFSSVDEKIYTLKDGSAYVRYKVKYKNYPNILFAYATGETKHLNKESKKNYDILKKIIDSEISDNFSDEEKVKAIHDYLVNNTDYDIVNYDKGTIPDRSYHITGLLQYNKSVCQGYTETFQLLMDMLKINSIHISGTANNSTNSGYNGHAWNLVEIDGKWYYIDVTWDDPSNVKKLRYDYYLVTEAVLSKNHRWDKEGLPVSDGKKTYTDEQNRNFIKKFAPDYIYYDTTDWSYQGDY